MSWERVTRHHDLRGSATEWRGCRSRTIVRRSPECIHEGVGSFADQEVAATVDRVQRPTELSAGLLGYPEASDPVVPAPDQYNGHADRPQVICRDPRHVDPPEQLTVGLAHPRLRRSVQVVGLECGPALTPLGSNAFRVDHDVPDDAIEVGRASVDAVPDERDQRPRCRQGTAEPTCIHEDDPADLVAVLDGEAGGQGSPERDADEGGRFGARLSDQVADGADRITRRPILGGLINEYERAA